MSDQATAPAAAPAAPAAPAATMADVLGKNGPALSATSDMPVPAPAPAAAEPAPPKPAEPENHDDAGSKAADETPAWMKAEITKERNRRRAAEQAAAEATARLDALLRREQPPTPAAFETPPAADPKPSRDQFDDPDAYDAALIEWAGKQAARTAVTETEKAAKERQAAEVQAREVEARQKTWSTAREQFIAKTPDYAEVAENPELPINMAMAAVITSHNDGPAIAYHLGKNPEVAARISALPPAQAVFELGIVAAQLKASKAPEISKAPEPPTPLGSRADAGRKTPNEESMDEYAARRTQELRKR